MLKSQWKMRVTGGHIKLSVGSSNNDMIEMKVKKFIISGCQSVRYSRTSIQQENKINLRCIHEHGQLMWTGNKTAQICGGKKKEATPSVKAGHLNGLL